MQRFVAPHCTILTGGDQICVHGILELVSRAAAEAQLRKEQAAQAKIKRQQAEEAAKRAAAEAAKKKEEAAKRAAAEAAKKKALQEALEAESKKRMLDEQFDKSNQLMKELMARRANLEAQEKEFKKARMNPPSPGPLLQRASNSLRKG